MMALAMDLSVHESAISRWRKGGPMSLEHAARISEVLNISLDWLVLGRGEMNPLTQNELAEEEHELLRLARGLKRSAVRRLVSFLQDLDQSSRA